MSKGEDYLLPSNIDIKSEISVKEEPLEEAVEEPLCYNVEKISETSKHDNEDTRFLFPFKSEFVKNEEIDDEQIINVACGSSSNVLTSPKKLVKVGISDVDSFLFSSYSKKIKKLNGGLFSCSTCSYKTNHLKDLKKHVLSHSKKSRIKISMKDLECKNDPLSASCGHEIEKAESVGKNLPQEDDVERLCCSSDAEDKELDEDFVGKRIGRSVEENEIENPLDEDELPDEDQESYCDSSSSDDDDQFAEVILENEDFDDNNEEYREEKNEDFIPKWKKKNEVVKLGSFCQKVGPTDVITTLPDPSPISIFKCFFTEKLLEHIAYQTNLFATQKLYPYKPTTSKEVELFLAINILMGIKRLPRYRLYWSSRRILRDEYVSKIMPQKRFEWFLRHIHLNDNSKMSRVGDKDYDRLYKVRPYIDMLNNQFEACYNPTECQSIGESMIKFKGRIDFKQYMPMKPIKRGFKVWVRACPNGYVCKFEIYTGKKSSKTEIGLGSRVVIELCKNLENKCYKIYADNFFSSVVLVKTLLDQGIGYCGTIRSKRKLLPILKYDKDMEIGECDWRMEDNGIIVSKWRDKRAVTVISSFHKGSEKVIVNRTQKDGSKKEFISLKCNSDYVKFMGGVDLADMLKSYYEVDRKSKKFWHRIFYHFLDVSIVNSYLIYKEVGKTDIKDLLEFRLHLVEDLVGCLPYKTKRISEEPISSPKKRFKFIIPDQVKFDKSEHMPISGSKRRCHYCSRKNNVHRTSFSCNICKVPLCVSTKNEKQCFINFHTKM